MPDGKYVKKYLHTTCSDVVVETILWHFHYFLLWLQIRKNYFNQSTQIPKQWNGVKELTLILNHSVIFKWENILKRLLQIIFESKKNLRTVKILRLLKKQHY